MVGLNSIEIKLECPYTEILGVFGEEVHLLTKGYNEKEDIDKLILIIPLEEYIKQWRNWLKGKKDYCERFNHYCGVMGYVYTENAKYVGNQKINEWNEEKENMEIIEVPVYKASKFWKEPDFEHG